MSAVVAFSAGLAKRRIDGNLWPDSPGYQPAADEAVDRILLALLGGPTRSGFQSAGATACLIAALGQLPLEAG